MYVRVSVRMSSLHCLAGMGSVLLAGGKAQACAVKKKVVHYAD